MTGIVQTVGLGLLCSCVAVAAQAQPKKADHPNGYPNKPVRMLVASI